MNALTVQILGKTYCVGNIAEARDLWNRIRDAEDFGFRRQAETIVMSGGEAIARISYNGRVWEPGPWETAREIVMQ